MEALTSSISKEKKNKGLARNNNVWCTNCKGQGHIAANCPSPANMKIMCLNCGKEGHPIEDCWYLTGNRPNGPNMMIPNTQYDVNQIQGGPRFGRNGQIPSNGNWNTQRNMENSRNGGFPQNSYQSIQECNQNDQNVNMRSGNQRGSFTQATWNKPSRYIPPEYPNFSNRMNPSKPVLCYRCRQYGHFAKECMNDRYEEDTSPLCANCKQQGHLTKDCNAPFNFNNKDSRP